VLIRITDKDIEGAGQHPLENPITRAISRLTGQTWVVFEGRSAHQLQSPYRALALPYDVYLLWQRYQTSGAMEPFEFDLNVENAPVRQERRDRSDRRGSDRRRGDRRRNERRNSRGDRRHRPRT